MTNLNRGQRIQELAANYTVDFILSLYRQDASQSSYASLVTLERLSDNTEESVYVNPAYEFIDNNSFISDGVTTVETWRDAAGASTLRVAKWEDVSGNGNDLVRPGGAFAYTRPTFNLNGAGVMGNMYFNGTDQYLALDNPNYSTASTFFIVYQRDGSQANGAGLFGCGVGSTINTFQISFDSSDYLSCVYTDNGGADSTITINSSQDNNSHLVTILTDGIDQIKTYYDGTYVNTTNDPSGFLSTYQQYKFGINRGSTHFKGYIKDAILIRSQLSDSARTRIENELKSNYGIS